MANRDETFVIDHLEVDTDYFSPLFQPLDINTVTVRNRFVMPAMQIGGAQGDQVSDKLLTYYRDRALGGTGLIITESLGIDHPTARLDWGVHTMILDAKSEQGWGRVIDAVKDAGARILVQLFHPGARASAAGGVEPIGPAGAYDGERHGQAATRFDMEELIDAYVLAASRAVSLGADGVEIHMAHGHLLNQFLSPAENTRTDEYGGALTANRVRFPSEIVAAVRSAIPDDKIISCRISQWSAADYDARVADTPEDLDVMISALRLAGADLFHLSTRWYRKPEWPELSDLSVAGWVKQMTDAPVITVGSVGLDTDTMVTLVTDQEEKAEYSSITDLVPRFERGDFDLIAVGRSIMADSEFVNKIAQGRIRDLEKFTRSCIAEVLGNVESKGREALAAGMIKAQQAASQS